MRRMNDLFEVRSYGILIGMAENCPPTTRHLYAWEIQEARRVFANQIDYDRVRIHECAGWPDNIYRIGLRLQGKPAKTDVHNAVTFGNHCYFPVRLLENLVEPSDPQFHKLPWLIHELTHIWQYQRLGWKYLVQALRVQLKEGSQAYVFGGEEGLRLRGSQGLKLEDFNLEQQGDIARSYYERLARGEDTAAWGRYVAEFQQNDSQTDVA